MQGVLLSFHIEVRSSGRSRPLRSAFRTSAFPPEKTLPEVSSIRLKVERRGVGGWLLEEGYV